MSADHKIRLPLGAPIQPDDAKPMWLFEAVYWTATKGGEFGFNPSTDRHVLDDAWAKILTPWAKNQLTVLGRPAGGGLSKKIPGESIAAGVRIIHLYGVGSFGLSASYPDYCWEPGEYSEFDEHGEPTVQKRRLRRATCPYIESFGRVVKFIEVNKQIWEFKELDCESWEFKGFDDKLYVPGQGGYTHLVVPGDELKELQSGISLREPPLNKKQQEKLGKDRAEAFISRENKRGKGRPKQDDFVKEVAVMDPPTSQRLARDSFKEAAAGKFPVRPGKPAKS